MWNTDPRVPADQTCSDSSTVSDGGGGPFLRTYCVLVATGAKRADTYEGEQLPP